VACGAVAFFFEAPEQSISIFAIIVLAVALDFFNEYRAEKTVEALRKKVSIKAVVVRDGKPSETDSTLLVPGDLVSLYVGDIVAADMRIVEAKDLHVNEAALTGESFPVEKTSEKLELQQPTPQQLRNYLFMSSIIANGTARGIVVHTPICREYPTSNIGPRAKVD
jgi:magnesium-transporting ATPase (P-type)